MRYFQSSKLVIGARTVIQDRFAQFRVNDVRVMLVCDGNGGDGGELIAEYAAKSIMGEVHYALKKTKHPSARQLRRVGIRALAETAEYINMLKRFRPEFQPCGTTATLVFIHETTVAALWIGDSPAFVYSGGKLVKLTDPAHNLVEMLISGGAKREELSVQAGLTAVITRCIGHSYATPDVKVMSFSAPMTVLAASDGVSVLPEAEIKRVIESNRLTECLPGKLILASLEHCSSDNITVAAIKAVTRKRISRKNIQRR